MPSDGKLPLRPETADPMPSRIRGRILLEPPKPVIALKNPANRAFAISEEVANATGAVLICHGVFQSSGYGDRGHGRMVA